MIVCNSCYSKNEDKVKLCNYCGASLSKKHESPKSTNTTEKKTTYQLNNITEHEIDSLSTNLSNQTDTVTCLGYYSNKGICTTSTSPLSTISINSYWRSFSIPNNTHIIFDYEPIKKVAYNIRIYPAPVNQTKKNKLEVKGGTVPTGDYYLTNKGLILRGETESVCLYGAKISLITEERAKHLITSVALGVVGTLATFGVGLVVGALHASKKYQLVEIRFSESEFLIVECRPSAYEQLLTAEVTGNKAIAQRDFLDSIKNGKNTNDIAKYFSSVQEKEKITMFASWAVIALVLLLIFKD
jgi:hypothetical protein